MNQPQEYQLRPFMSVIFIVATLFIIVFFRMEERRFGYQVLRLNKEHKNKITQLREQEIRLAKLTRPQLLESIAHRKLTLKKIQANQIIHISGNLVVGNPDFNKSRQLTNTVESNLETP